MCVNLTCDVAPVTQSISDPSSRIRPPQIEFKMNFMVIILSISVSLTLSFCLSGVLHQTVATQAGLLSFQQSLPLSFPYHSNTSQRATPSPKNSDTYLNPFNITHKSFTLSLTCRPEKYIKQRKILYDVVLRWQVHCRWRIKEKKIIFQIFFQNNYLLILNLHTLLISRLQSVHINSLCMQWVFFFLFSKLLMCWS